MARERTEQEELVLAVFRDILYEGRNLASALAQYDSGWADHYIVDRVLDSSPWIRRDLDAERTRPEFLMPGYVEATFMEAKPPASLVVGDKIRVFYKDREALMEITQVDILSDGSITYEGRGIREETNA
jgi:hypothetical protein